jgi:hypothetical protein
MTKNPMGQIYKATYLRPDLVYEVRKNTFSLDPVNDWLLEVRTRKGDVVAVAKDLSPSQAFALVKDWTPDVNITYYP